MTKDYVCVLVYNYRITMCLVIESVSIHVIIDLIYLVCVNLKLLFFITVKWQLCYKIIAYFCICINNVPISK